MENLAWICAGLAILVVLLGAVLGALASQFQPVKPCGPDGLFRGFRRRSLAMELARDYQEVLAILGPHNQRNRTVMRQIQAVDFGFIAAYWALFLAAAAALAHRPFPFSFAAGLTLVVCATTAAVFDIKENGYIWRITKMPLDDSVQPLIKQCRKAAQIKWALTFVVILLLSMMFLLALPYEAPNGWIFRIPGAVLAGMAVTGLATLPFGGRFERAAAWMGPTLLVLAAAFIFCAVQNVPLM